MCVYCEDRDVMIRNNEIFVQINPYYNSPTHLMIGVEDGDFYSENNLDIKHCPMCGKKLLEEDK